MPSSRKRILIVLGFLNEDILAGFARYAREANWILNAFSVLHGSIPRHWRADGLLTTNVFRPDLRRFVRETARRIPTVLHGCNDLGISVPNVECDERAGGRIAARHLIEQGHRHFAFFQYSRNRHALLRQEGFSTCLAEAGYGCALLEKISQHGAGAGAWFRRQLERMPKPLGLSAEDDLLASEAIDAALDSGWRVPEDLAVVGNGNLPLICDLGRVPITSIMIPFEEQAYSAAAMLDGILAGKKPEPAVFPPLRLVPRQSTNAVAARRPAVLKALSWMAARMDDPTLDAAAVAAGAGVSLRLLYKEFHHGLLRLDVVNGAVDQQVTDRRHRASLEVAAVGEGQYRPAFP